MTINRKMQQINNNNGGNIKRYRMRLFGMIASLVVTIYSGTAHAAQCDAGYYMNDASVCVVCTNGYYCTGDDTRTKCPDNPFDADYISSKYGITPDSMSTMYVSSSYKNNYPASIDDCGIAMSNAYDGVAHFYCVLAYYSPTVPGSYAEMPSIRKYYRTANNGYYLSVKDIGSYYVYVKPCTNAPENAHYTGPGIPDVGDCPWECDAGFGHTSDDRCLPLCRIGETTMNGINIYAEKHTKYAMAVPRMGSVCWISATRNDGGKLVPIN
ncbi:MAG: hypothetical protein IJ560_00115 [Alphaproteobacteria bacterium]|nr:hypothetical protein [Alphaproteobacteria bacterium]